MNDYLDTESSSIQQELIKEKVIQQRQKVLHDTQKNIERSLRRNADKKLKNMARLEKNIANCQEFLEEIDRSTMNHEETLQNKRRHQFEEWNNQVFGEIQTKLLEKINQIDSRELNRMKNEDYQKYLDITNRKAAIFRDTIIEGEYDPLEVNRRATRVSMARLKDPTNVYAQKQAAEAAMLELDHSVMQRKPVFGKYTLPTELWLAGKIEATPYGLERVRNSTSIASTNSLKHRSKVEFDHFNYPKGKAAVTAEMPRGKRAGEESF